MTERLYRADAYLQQFDARIVARLEHGGKNAVVLDRTAFYPTAGGQPNDLGILGGAPVLDVIEREDGEILHVLDAAAAPNPRGDGSVLGVLDWPRRFEHMQQHSGQHVLSQAFVRVANLDTIAVHIGADENTLDVPAPQLAADVVERAEREANAIVAEDRPFVIYEVGEADLARIPLRKQPTVRGRIRIVEVEGYDWSACGGTHVRATAHIGQIKVTRVEKRGDDTRVSFRCGVRALRDYARLNDATARLMDALNAPRYEIEPAVLKLMAEAKSSHKALQEARARLLTYEAAEILAAAPAPADGARVIIRAFDQRDPNELRALAKLLTGGRGVVALLGASGDKSQFVFARSKDAPGDMAVALKRALAALSPEGKAKGGGSAEFAQGGGVQADVGLVERALDAAAAA